MLHSESLFAVSVREPDRAPSESKVSRHVNTPVVDHERVVVDWPPVQATSVDHAGVKPVDQIESPHEPATDALLLTEKQAAVMLSISPRKLWELRMCGEIPHVRMGRSVRYDPDDLRDWIKASKRIR